jgi:hypothetical protein
MSFDVPRYWDSRYAKARGNSGPGSRGLAAVRKAAYVNSLISERNVRTVIDWGCGDGVVASRLVVHRYIGLDVSERAIARAMTRPPEAEAEWHVYDGFCSPELPRADLALSLDVMFHLVDESLYRAYLEMLFASARYVCIASTDYESSARAHVRHRNFSKDISGRWKVLRKAPPREIGFWLFKSKRGE